VRARNAQAQAQAEIDGKATGRFENFRSAIAVGKGRLETTWDLRAQRFDCLTDASDGDTSCSEAAAAFAQYEIKVMQRSRRSWGTDDFQEICELGSGAFGTVHLVREKMEGGIFALKQMSKSRYKRKNYRDRAYAERDLLGQARTRWFVELFATFQDSDHVFMLMEFVQGGELFKYLQDKNRFTPEETAFYMAELLLALDCVHKHGFVHRDVKPDNIMLTASGHMKLLDFGLCKAEVPTAEDLRELEPGTSRRARMASKVGTPQYMSPEAYVGGGSASSDLWALGVVTFECLYGGVPFHAGAKEGLEAVRVIQKLVANHAVVFPKRLAKARVHGFMPPQAELLLKGIICDEQYRLTVQDIKLEPFFAGIDFENIHTAAPPIRPSISGPLDVSNFEDSEKKKELPSRHYGVPKDFDLDWVHYEFDVFSSSLQRPEALKEALGSGDSDVASSYVPSPPRGRPDTPGSDEGAARRLHSPPDRL